MAVEPLRVDNLFCERDERVLFEGLSFSVSAGDVVRIEGQNGSGKTTLLRMLTGLSNHYEGTFTGVISCCLNAPMSIARICCILAIRRG
ncbi:ATP-binding cassette domain-containing protein [Aliamphritea spongicola]|nr:ATP-binding cassette domain-containing protein [Aliamphritea spongicola]